MKNQYMDHYTKTNKALWNEKVPYHLKAELYDMEAFLAGANTLREPELAELGDVRGQSLLHLQCHFGQDTLSLARMGADCTGVDFSDKAVAEARRLNGQLGLDARFVEADVMALPDHLEGQFDKVFTSYGALVWLADLDRWAEVVNHFLRPGGELVVAEFHPALYMLDWDSLKVAYNYFTPSQPDYEVTEGTYADPDAPIRMEEYTWTHSFEELIMPLLRRGFSLRSFREYDYSPYDCFPGLKQVGDLRWKFDSLADKAIPYVFALRMRKEVE